MPDLAYLADHPDLVPVLARWHHAEWGSLIRDWTLELAESELRSHTRRRALSTTVVALERGEPVGSASLLEEDMPDMPPLGPWLASVYVVPDHRNRGIGGLLVSRIVEEAQALGVERVYLFTGNARPYYESRGWQVLQPIVAAGYEGVIMHLDLRAGRYSFQHRTADTAPTREEP
jgi:predicted N-acetyltransferase YhbS